MNGLALESCFPSGPAPPVWPASREGAAGGQGIDEHVPTKPGLGKLFVA